LAGIGIGLLIWLGYSMWFGESKDETKTTSTGSTTATTGGSSSGGAGGAGGSGSSGSPFDSAEGKQALAAITMTGRQFERLNSNFVKFSRMFGLKANGEVIRNKDLLDDSPVELQTYELPEVQTADDTTNPSAKTPETKFEEPKSYKDAMIKLAHAQAQQRKLKRDIENAKDVIEDSTITIEKSADKSRVAMEKAQEMEAKAKEVTERIEHLKNFVDKTKPLGSQPAGGLATINEDDEAGASGRGGISA